VDILFKRNFLNFFKFYFFIIKYELNLTNNKKYFCLGGGRQNDDSLYQYKKSFFPYDEEAMYYTGRKIINSDIFNQLIKKYNISIKHSIESFKDPKEYFPIYNNPKIKK